MAEQTRNYMITALVTVAAACLTMSISGRQPQVSFEARLDALPMTVGDWRGQDIRIDAGTRDALSADGFLYRSYTHKGTGRQIGLLIVYRKYGRREFAHRPELCYPAAGWEIIRKSYTDMPYAGSSVPARLVVAEQEGYREVITYWFASGRRTEANYLKQQARMALDRMQPQTYGWAFIRVNTPEWYGHGEALDLTRDFADDLQAPLETVLSGRD